MIALQFMEPAWLALLVVAFAWAAFDRRRAKRGISAAEAWMGPRRDRIAPPRRDDKKDSQSRWCGALALASLVIALSRPQWGEPVARSGAAGADVVLCLDVSRSMRARDIAPDRASAVRSMIRRYCERATGDRAALVAFAGNAVVRVPLTSDLLSLAQIADAVDELDVAKGGTDLAAALDAAALALVGCAHGAVVALTDGEDPDGRGVAAAKQLLAQGHEVHCVAIGGERGARIPTVVAGREDYLRDATGAVVETAPDRAALAAIAAAGGGAFRSIDTADQDALSRLRDEQIAERLVVARTERGELAPPDRFAWLLLAAFALWMAAMALRRSADAVRA